MLRVLVNEGDKITHVLVYDDDDNNVNNITTIKGCMICPTEKMGYDIWFRPSFRELKEGEEFQIAFTEDILSSGKLYIKGDYRNRKDCVIDFNENKITVRPLGREKILIQQKQSVPTLMNIKTLVIKKKFDV